MGHTSLLFITLNDQSSGNFLNRTDFLLYTSKVSYAGLVQKYAGYLSIEFTNPKTIFSSSLSTGLLFEVLR